VPGGFSQEEEGHCNISRKRKRQKSTKERAIVFVMFPDSDSVKCMCVELFKIMYFFIKEKNGE
jgi:hypothetical protein